MDIYVNLWRIYFMNRASTPDRIKRLELISARLKSDEALTVAGIAEELGVSIRTLTRDIQVLREQGVPIEADRGRGGGVRLHRTWGVGRVNFTYSEAIDLLVSLAVAEQMKSPFFMAELAPIRRKLLASFSPRLKNEISGLKARILIGETASSYVLSAFSPPVRNVVETLHQGFVTKGLLEIGYRANDGRTSVRLIEPHYLLMNSPVWYVLAFDHLRDAVRTFRCDRMETAEVLPETFMLRPRSDFDAALEGVAAIAP